jgi:ferredoxin--NADP+ reductase
VPDGPLTSHLQKIVPGDTILLRQKSTGTLVLDALKPGRRLWMIATGTGIAPFASLIRDPETYDKFEQVVLTNTCRGVAELQYGDRLVAAVAEDPLIGELTAGRLTYYATTTRDASPRKGRITDLIASGKLFSDLGFEAFDPATDRVMICGSIDMIRDVSKLVEEAGLVEGSNAAPADFVVERAFVG